MIRSLFIVLLVLLTPLAWAEEASAERYVAGQHYALLDMPVRTRDRNKIEVVEVFWYGCSHCYHFDPLISQWKKTLAADVDFWLSPAVWNENMRMHANAFYTAKALKVEQQLHEPLFVALVVERKGLNTLAQLEDFFAEFGVDREKFNKTFMSFGVTSQVRQAEARARSYKISGTPEMIVNGKYRVSASMAGSQANMLKVASFLIEKERKAAVAAQ